MSSAVLAALQHERAAMEADGTWQVDAEVIMPDHVHYLFELGPRLPLGRTIARLKGRTASNLHAAGLSWQSGYFDHRLRDKEDMLPVLFYILLNPVRAGLTDRGESWPGYHCSSPVWEWFKEYAHEAVVEPAWLSATERVK